MRNFSILMLVLVLLCAGSAFSQAVRVQVERAADQQAIQRDKTALADDRMDLYRLSDLVMKWDQLRKTRVAAAELELVEKAIAVELRRDLAENRMQVEAAQKEVKQSEKELRQSRREVRRERKDDDHDKAALRDDRRDRRDDRRDVKDDVKDAEKAAELLHKKQAVAIELFEVQKKIDAAGPVVDKALRHQQEVLLEKYLALSHEEIKLGYRELQEDKSEKREDRRERREDRRQ